ncbi:MAG: hypothetical protein GF398_06155 [Chitinivibrionales bacterium]|nr:hypothetical protein [Chitinivibrionales bacterium]
MIQPVKKLSLLLYHKEKERFLNKLQGLGVVHIVENPDATSATLQSIQSKLKNSERVSKALSLIAKSSPEPVSKADAKSAEQILKEYDELDSRKESLAAQLQAQKKNIALLRPWGDFAPEQVARLSQVGITLRFFETTEKKFNTLPREKLTLEVISHHGSTVYFVSLERNERAEIAADEVTLPTTSLSAAHKEVERLESQKAAAEHELLQLSAYCDVLDEYLADQQVGRDYEAAGLSMENGAEGRVLSLTGWIPENLQNKVAAFLDTFPAWYSFTDATPDDNAPVKLKNNKFACLFEPIINIYSLPDYFELDPTPFVAPFFAFFFGICLGDLGYGLLLLIISAIGLVKGPAKLKIFMYLGLVLGVTTSIGGLLLNTFFGHAIFAVPGMENGYFPNGPGAALLTPVATDTGTYFPAMPFSLYIGLLQMMFGVILKMINRVRNQGPVYGIQPLATLLMIAGIGILMTKIDFIDLRKFSFGIVQVGESIASIPDSVMQALIFGGLGLLLLFNNPQKIIPVRLGLGLWELYNFAQGLMGDSLSYLRLFALGLAGGLLGAAFNQIAFMFVTSETGDVSYGSPLIVFTILILIFGHALNFALASLGAFVHPLRLTFVEFYNNLEFNGGAKPFRPFTREIK